MVVNCKQQIADCRLQIADCITTSEWAEMLKSSPNSVFLSDLAGIEGGAGKESLLVAISVLMLK